MQQAERLGAIMERLSLDGSVNVVEIARELEVSAATVRRDLRLLEDQRLLGRIHGGAVPQGVLYELPQQAERLGAIMERLSLDGSVNVVEIARDLDVSSATVRRDLRLLENQRLLGRIHGGAVPQGVLYELPLRYKSTRQPEQKRRIAREAATRVLDGWAIGLTGGTTTTEVARALVDRPRLTSSRTRSTSPPKSPCGQTSSWW